MGEVVTKNKFENAYKSAERIVNEILPHIRKLEEERKRERDREKQRAIKNEIDKTRKEQGKLYRSIVNDVLEAWENMKISAISDSDLDMFIRPAGIAEAIACSLSFKTTQLRKAFHQLRSLQYDAKQDELKLYKVRKTIAFLAYSAGRNLIDEDFFKFAKGLLEKVKDKGDLDLVVELLEAIVAYRKYYES